MGPSRRRVLGGKEKALFPKSARMVMVIPPNVEGPRLKKRKIGTRTPKLVKMSRLKVTRREMPDLLP